MLNYADYAYLLKVQNLYSLELAPLNRAAIYMDLVYQHQKPEKKKIIIFCSMSDDSSLKMSDRHMSDTVTEKFYYIRTADGRCFFLSSSETFSIFS